MARRPTLARWLLLAAAFAAPSLAQATKTQPRTEVAVLVVATDARSEVETARVTRGVEDALRSGGRLAPVEWELALNPAAARDRAAKVQTAKLAFEQAVSAYNDLDTEKALQWIERAMEAYEAADLSRSWSEYTRAWAMKAACLVADGDKARAQLELSGLMAVDPKVELPTSQFPKDVLAFAEKQRAAPGKTTLELDSVPSGAAVFVDGQLRGFAPVRLSGLASGSHFVTFRSPGFAVEQRRVRDGTHRIPLRPAELAPELTRARAAIAQAPQGKPRDDAARALGQVVGAQQVLVVVLRKSTTGERLEYEAVRLDVTDGHTYGEGRGTLPLGAGLEAAVLPASAALISKDAPRGSSGAPVLSSSSSGGAFAWTGRHTGYVLLGTGAAALGVATYFTAQAFSSHSEFRRTPQTEPRATELQQSGKTFALTADVTMIAGVLLAGAGSYFAFLAPDPDAAKPAVASVPMPPPPAPPKKNRAEDDDLKNH